jgi:hypothetical protein
VSPLYAAAAAVSDARGDAEAADRILTLLESLHENAEPRDRDTVPLARWASYVSPLLARRGRGEEALRLLTETTWRRGTRLGLLLHARCEVIATIGMWDGIEDLLAEAREYARRMELEALPHAADALEGTWLLATSRVERAALLLGAAVDGFGDLGAKWDQVRAALVLVEVLLTADRFDEASGVLSSIRLPVESLGAVRELIRFEELESLLPEP